MKLKGKSEPMSSRPVMVGVSGGPEVVQGGPGYSYGAKITD